MQTGPGAWAPTRCRIIEHRKFLRRRLAAVLISRVSRRGGSRKREQRLQESYWNSEIRASEAFQNRIRDGDDFPPVIEKWAARSSRCCLRIEDDFVRQDVSDVALRNDRMNEIAARYLGQNLRNVPATLSQDLFDRAFVCAREDARKPGRIAHRYDRLTAHSRSLAWVDRKGWTF